MRTLISVVAITAAFAALGMEAEAGQRGMASYYGYRSKTASGEMMNPSAMTAAHRTLPFGTRVRVTNTRTGQSVIVRINDRGPFIRGRIIDVSTGAARALGMTGSGVAPVEVDVVS
jgi:rare lipoprotein A